MSRKDSQRRRGHNFRYVALHQKYVTVTSPGGRQLDDYQNAPNNPVFCEKSAVLSQDMIALAQKRISVEYNVQTRFSTNFNLLDRLIFLESGRTTYDHTSILAVESLRDKSGRKEYLNLRCKDSAYAGQVAVQPATDNFLVVKMFDFNIQNIENSELPDLTAMAFNMGFGPADLVMFGSDYKNHFLIEAGASQRPAVLVPDSINAVKDISTGQDTAFQEVAVPGKDFLKIFQAPVGLIADPTKDQLLELVYE